LALRRLHRLLPGTLWLTLRRLYRLSAATLAAALLLPMPGGGPAAIASLPMAVLPLAASSRAVLMGLDPLPQPHEMSRAPLVA